MHDIKVLLERSNMVVKMTPWFPDVEALLMYEHVAFGIGKQRMQSTVEKKALFKVDKSGKFGYFPAGMLESVQAFLVRKKCVVTYKDYREKNLMNLKPELGKLPELRPGQREAIDAVINHDHGMLVCGTGFGKSFMIRCLCLIYPTARFVIVAPGQNDVKNLYYRIKEDFPKETSLLCTGSKDAPDNRIVISTTKSMIKADFHNCDFFIYDEAHGCGQNESTQQLLSHLEGSRIYGFTATPTGRGDRSDKVMEAIFGPVIYERTYQECEETGTVSPIEVLVYDIPGKIETGSRYETFVSKKRKLYWRNEERNLSIACLANAIPADEQILIMVETVDHMMHLAKYLPDFTLVLGESEDILKRAKSHKIKLRNTVADNPKAIKQVYNDMKNGIIKRVISTYVWKQAVDIQGLTVLIRGDGSPSPIASYQIPGRLSRLAEGKTKGILIDFRDTFNEGALRNYYARLRTYKKNGWKITHRGSVLDERFSDRL